MKRADRNRETGFTMMTVKNGAYGLLGGSVLFQAEFLVNHAFTDTFHQPVLDGLTLFVFLLYLFAGLAWGLGVSLARSAVEGISGRGPDLRPLAFLFLPAAAYIVFTLPSQVPPFKAHKALVIALGLPVVLLGISLLTVLLNRVKGLSIGLVAAGVWLATIVPGFFLMEEREAGEPGPTLTVDDRGSDKHNLILITVDTTRRSNLGCYGYPEARTPVLDGLAGEGLCFEEAYTVANSTGPSHATILTGTYPSRNGVLANGWRLKEEAVSLAEILARCGYDTGRAISVSHINGSYGFSQGFRWTFEGGGIQKLYPFFRTYFNDFGFVIPELMRRTLFPAPHQWRAGTTVDAALDWFSRLDDGGGPIFFWLHLFDPHIPYTPPAAFRRGDSPVERYDGEIAYMDSEIGRFLEGVSARVGTDRETITLVAADHGEHLGEHGGLWGHSLTLYKEEVDVPLILHAPALIGAERVRGAVATVDLVPTLLDLLEIRTDIPFDGRTLLPLGRGEPSMEERPIFLYGRSYMVPDKYGLILDDVKVVEDDEGLHAMTADDERLLPDGAADTEENTIRTALALYRQHPKGGKADMEGHSLDAETVEMLKALGYMGDE